MGVFTWGLGAQPFLKLNPTISKGQHMSTTPTFAEAKGTEANQHAKKLAQAKSKAKKQAEFPTYYVQEGYKVLSVTFKPHGVYRNYIGNISKTKEKSQLQTMMKKWKEEGLLLFPQEIKEKAEEIALQQSKKK